MEKQTEKQQNDIFLGIDMQKFEEDLIDVDAKDIDGEVIDDMDLENAKPGTGDPGEKTTETTGEKPEQPPQKLPESELIDVDEPAKPAEPEDKTETKKDIPETQSEKDTGTGSTPKDEEIESPIILHAATLLEAGVLPNFDLNNLKDKDPAEALEIMNNHISDQIDTSIKDGINDYKENLAKPVIDFLEKLEKGIPFEDLSDHQSYKNQFESISVKDLEDNEELQEQLYSESLRMKGFNDARIKKYVDTARENGELFTEAKEGMNDIEAYIKSEDEHLESEAKNREEITKKRSEEIATKIKETLKNTKEIIPGHELTEADRKRLELMMTKPVAYIERDGQQIPITAAQKIRSEDPYLFEMRLNYYIDKHLFDKVPDFSFTESKVEKKTAKKFIDVFSKESPKLKVEKETIKDTSKEEPDVIFPSFITNK